jgi:hypothetical protein
MTRAYRAADPPDDMTIRRRVRSVWGSRLRATVILAGWTLVIAFFAVIAWLAWRIVPRLDW